MDVEWVEPFLRDLVSRWLAAADDPRGLFYPHLDRQWHRREDRECTLVSQSRLTYNLARAHELGYGARYREAARRGLDALERYFRVGDDGWRWSCAADGSPGDDARQSYGHAFVILALATAARALKADEYRLRALEAWRYVKAAFGDRHGGVVRQAGAGRAKVEEDLRTQNPLMHLFEALLVLGALQGDEEALEGARGIWGLLRRRLTNGGLPEWYDAEWRPLEAGERSGFDIGHQFEWGFLLSEAHALGLGEGLLDEGRRLVEFGLTHGFDADNGAAISPVDLHLRPRTGRKGWWEQCECIRTLARFVRRHGRAEWEEPLERCVGFVRRHFIDPEYGGVFSNPAAAGGPERLDKGNAYKCDYHVVNACIELTGR